MAIDGHIHMDGGTYIGESLAIDGERPYDLVARSNYEYFCCMLTRLPLLSRAKFTEGRVGHPAVSDSDAHGVE